MPLVATEGDSAPRQLPPGGTHVARCYQIIDLGTQAGEYMGKPNRKRKVRITWELPDEKAVFNPDNGEQPFVVSKTYTLSLNEKSALRHDLEAWRGKAFTADELKRFELDGLLGAPCLLTIIHQTKGEKTYANINGLARLTKGMKCPPAINPPVLYEVAMGRNAVFSGLPDWMRETIGKCEEWNKAE